MSGVGGLDASQSLVSPEVAGCECGLEHVGEWVGSFGCGHAAKRGSVDLTGPFEGVLSLLWWLLSFHFGLLRSLACLELRADWVAFCPGCAAGLPWQLVFRWLIFQRAVL